MNPAPPEADPLARGWALKAACYAAWHTEPPRARDAAQALRALAQAHPEPALQPLADWTEGIAALAAGELVPALASLERAQAGFEALGDGQHAAETQVPQMVALSMMGRDAEAAQRAELAAARFAASGDRRSAAKVELNLGTMLSRQDRHADAERRFRSAAVQLARSGDRELSIAADLGLANALTWQFRFDDALRIYERVRMRAESTGFGILHAQAHQGTGRIELHRGHWQRALQALAASVRLFEQHGAPPTRRIEAEAALADAYLAVNLLDEAVQLYEQVIEAALALPAPTEAAWATLQRARALGRLGDDAAAAAGFAQARALYEAAGNAATVAYCDLQQARVALAAGRPEAALAGAQAAAAALAGSGITGWWLESLALGAAAQLALGQPAQARAALESVRDAAAALSPIRLACEAGLGRLAAQAGDLPAARRALEAALDLVDRERAALPDDEFRSALAREAAQAHDDLIGVALAEGDPVRLLADLERGRARALALGVGAPATATGEDDPALGWLRGQWRQAMADGDTPRLPALADEVHRLEQSLLERRRRERLRPAAAGAVERPFELPALQAALGADTALVAWHRHGDRLLAVVATADGVALHDGAAAGLEERLRGLRFQIDSLRHGGAAMRRHAARLMARVQDHARALHEMVWAPVLPLLGGRTRVIGVPHRELHYLPFAALHDGRRWLAETHALSLAPSAAVWLTQQQRPAVSLKRVLAFAADSAALPQVAQEVAAVAAAFGDGVTLRLDGEATLAAWLAESPAADVLHLACHGRFRADNPAFSFLQLGDGPLALHEVRAQRLRARLVVLSACETGVSRVAPGDEVLGLVRAFTLAGAGAVLATLWPVDDAASALLVADFYAALRAGASPAHALQQAQAAAAAAGEHPFLWAAFALHGQG